VLLWSVVSQTPDGRVPPKAARFLTGPLFFDAVQWPGPGGDFFALYHGGLQVRRGHSPHDLTSVDGDAAYFFRYIYSPALAQTLGRVVTALPSRAAYLVWVAAIEACLATWLVLLWREPVPESARAFAIILLLISQPYVLELHMGQFTFVAVGLTLLAARSRSGTIGGIALFLGVLLKTFPAVTFPAFLRRHTRRALGGGMLAALVVVLSALFESRGSGHFALGMVDTMGGPHPGAESLSQAAYVLLLASTGVWVPAIVSWLPSLVVGVTVCLTAWIVLRRHASSALLGCCAMLLAFFLSYLHVWEHHYSAVVLITAIAFVEIAKVSTRGDANRQALGIAAILLALPSPFVFVGPAFQSWTVASWLLMSVSKGLPTALAFVAVLGALAQDRAAAISTASPSPAGLRSRPSTTSPLIR
jgi:hypothetical protein